MANFSVLEFMLWLLTRTVSAGHNICFGWEIRKIISEFCSKSHIFAYFRPDVQLIEEDIEIPRGELELDEVTITNPKLDEILSNEQWVDDVT